MRTASIEDPRPNEVLVRMVGTGICQTDAHIRDQDYSTPLSVILRP
jgi:aryl-alcohol dehydrogenase